MSIETKDNCFSPSAPTLDECNDNVPVCYPEYSSQHGADFRISSENANEGFYQKLSNIHPPINLNININGSGKNKTNIKNNCEDNENVDINVYKTLDMFKKYEQEDILHFADYLDVNIVKYPFCLKYVLEAMYAPLPKHWEELISDNGEKYFHNKRLFVSSWTHPLDPFYKEYIKDKIKQHKKNNKSKCTIL